MVRQPCRGTQVRPYSERGFAGLPNVGRCSLSVPIAIDASFTIAPSVVQLSGATAEESFFKVRACSPGEPMHKAKTTVVDLEPQTKG